MKNNIFEINDLSDIQEEVIDGSKIYIKDNFYKNPELVLEFIESHQAEVWKSNEKPSYNMIYFEELRHHIHVEDLSFIEDKISKIIKQKPSKNNTLATNYIKFRNTEFNDYTNNYWWPHVDSGYNAIIYFDKFDEEIPGTNLYRKTNEFKYDQHEFPEHFKPWIKKEYWEVLHTFQSKFNRLVMFDGKKFFHGMSINDNRFFFETYRKNQVIFFEK